jgi:polyphosphate kinase
MTNSKKLINREISWLHFNGRVLQEAADPNVPLLERIKFLGIFSNNLDEFFRVRVATLNRMLKFRKRDYKFINFNPAQILKQIFEIEQLQQKDFTDIFRRIVRELADENIFIINEKELSPEQGEFVMNYFKNHVRTNLFPLMLENVDDAGWLKDKSIYLAIELKKSKVPDSRTFSLIKVPTSTISRFLLLPEQDGKKFIILLDDVIRYGLPGIFSIFGYDKYEAYTIKFTRDAEMDFENDVSKSFLEVMTESLKQRKMGSPVRFIYDKSMPTDLLELLMKKLDITEYDTVSKRGRYHNFKDFMSFPDVKRPDLGYLPAPPLPHPAISLQTSIFDLLKQQDIMLHYPYQSYHYVIDLLREASIDPKVRAIKITLYRVARFSNVINALINAARNGKQVTVFLELQARFDEAANIYWSEKLIEEGVKIIHTIPGTKVHSKLLLIRRKENADNVYYASIGTGNFNEATARVYADDSLLTSRKEIVDDVNKVFHMFDAKYQPPKFKNLVVAPFEMRNFFINMLNREMRNAQAGKEAWVLIKLNSLSDEKIVKKLYKASQAGVKIRLIIRGICVLVPGIPGLSENIEAISIVDKFLEHSRVFVFCNGGDEKYYISSADWMIRNFDNRIEVACPILDPVIQKELRDILEIQWRDNQKARLVNTHPINKYRKNGSKEKVRAQVEIYEYFKKKLSDPS